MVTDLHTKLRTAIEARLKLAEAAASHCGCCAPTPEWVFEDDENEGRIIIWGDRHPGVRKRLSSRWNRSYSDLFTARHIAANDPAFTIRACRADLDRLEDHQRELKPGSWCDECSQAWPCPEIRHLAAVYAVEVDE